MTARLTGGIIPNRAPARATRVCVQRVHVAQAQLAPSSVGVTTAVALRALVQARKCCASCLIPRCSSVYYRCFRLLCCWFSATSAETDRPYGRRKPVIAIRAQLFAMWCTPGCSRCSTGESEVGRDHERSLTEAWSESVARALRSFQPVPGIVKSRDVIVHGSGARFGNRFRLHRTLSVRCRLSPNSSQ